MILTPDSVASDAVIDVITRSREDDGMGLVQAAKVIRQDMSDKANTFHGNFDKKSQEDSVPTSLMMLVRMILEGTNISPTTSTATCQAALTISHLIKFNSVKWKRRESTTFVRHATRDMINSKTRKRSLIWV